MQFSTEPEYLSAVETVFVFFTVQILHTIRKTVIKSTAATHFSRFAGLATERIAAAVIAITEITVKTVSKAVEKKIN